MKIATLSQQSSTTSEISKLDVPFIYADNFKIYGTLFSPTEEKIFHFLFLQNSQNFEKPKTSAS